MGLHHVFNSNTISHVHALAFLEKKKKQQNFREWEDSEEDMKN